MKPHSGTLVIDISGGEKAEAYEGVYQCTARNELGTAVSNNIIIRQSSTWPYELSSNQMMRRHTLAHFHHINHYKCFTVLCSQDLFSMIMDLILKGKCDFVCNACDGPPDPPGDWPSECFRSHSPLHFPASSPQCCHHDWNVITATHRNESVVFPAGSPLWSKERVNPIIAQEGQSLVLPCRPPAGLPPPIIFWMDNSKNLI